MAALPQVFRQFGWYNLSARKFIELGALAGTSRNDVLIKSGVIIRLYVVVPPEERKSLNGQD